MRFADTFVRRFTFRQRMLALIVVMVVMLIASGGAGVAGMVRMHATSQEFLDESFAVADEVSTLTQHYGFLRRHEKDLAVNYESEAEIARLKREWTATADRLAVDLQALGQRPASAAHREVVARAANDLEAYRRAFLPVLRQIEAANYDSATVINKVSRGAQDAARSMEATLVELQTRVRADARTAEVSMRDSALQTLIAVAGALALALALLLPLMAASARTITQPILQARSLAQAIAAGDLTQPIDGSGRDEAAELMASLAAMQQALRSLVGQVHQAAESVHVASSEVAMGNQDLSQRTEHAAANLEQTAGFLEQLSTAVRQSAQAAAEADRLAVSASEVAHRGGAAVEQVVSTMDRITASSRRIADIIGVIDGIAFQTNILALNAAVEAARAGEQGRGFAVVAGEVRGLARRSAEAAKEIKALIGDSVGNVEAGSRLVHEAGTTMQEVMASVQHVTAVLAEIKTATAEQAGGLEQVHATVGTLDRSTQQNAALVEQSAAAAESLRDQSARLNEMVAVFRT